MYYTLILGEESEIQDFVPLSPQLSFSADAGQLVIVPETEGSSPRRRVSRDRLTSSPKPGDTGVIQKPSGDDRQKNDVPFNVQIKSNLGRKCVSIR